MVAACINKWENDQKTRLDPQQISIKGKRMLFSVPCLCDHLYKNRLTPQLLRICFGDLITKLSWLQKLIIIAFHLVVHERLCPQTLHIYTHRQTWVKTSWVIITYNNLVEIEALAKTYFIYCFIRFLNIFCFQQDVGEVNRYTLHQY